MVRVLFRNDELESHHQREVMQLETFLGLIAGVFRVLITIIRAVFGKYLDFLTDIRHIKAYYKFGSGVKSEDEEKL